MSVATKYPRRLLGLDVGDRRIGMAISDELGLTAQGLSTLEHLCHLPCIRWDERLTTRQAERLLIAAKQRRHKRKLVRDKIAAQLILQNYLDYQRAQASRCS